jgi:hypothetical protein
MKSIRYLLLNSSVTTPSSVPDAIHSVRSLGQQSLAEHPDLELVGTVNLFTRNLLPFLMVASVGPDGKVTAHAPHWVRANPSDVIVAEEAYETFGFDFSRYSPAQMKSCESLADQITDEMHRVESFYQLTKSSFWACPFVGRMIAKTKKAPLVLSHEFAPQEGDCFCVNGEVRLLPRREVAA